MKKLNERYCPYRIMSIPHEGSFDPGFIEQEDFIEFSDEDEFEIGQEYTNEPDKKIICKYCKSDKWIVGQGEYHTSIKCINCKYEICIHNG